MAFTGTEMVIVLISDPARDVSTERRCPLVRGRDNTLAPNQSTWPVNGLRAEVPHAAHDRNGETVAGDKGVV
jgi:hypothetical protein